MNGAMAPTLWSEGKRETVLEYVAQDVRTTAELATECEACGALRWITKSGKARRMMLPRGWLTTEQAERLPKPNTSWMTDPWVPPRKLRSKIRDRKSGSLKVGPDHEQHSARHQGLFGDFPSLNPP